MQQVSDSKKSCAPTSFYHENQIVISNSARDVVYEKKLERVFSLFHG
jgi:hypothetical protein